MTWMRAQSSANVDGGEVHDIVYEMAFLGIWTCLIGCTLVKAFSLTKFLDKGYTRLHEEMLESLIKSPMLFYDSVSIGSIINRFVKDLDEGKIVFNFKNSYGKTWNR